LRVLFQPKTTSQFYYLINLLNTGGLFQQISYILIAVLATKNWNGHSYIMRPEKKEGKEVKEAKQGTGISLICIPSIYGNSYHACN
jgi:hypothetical protein